MKKYIPHILISAIVLAAAILIFSSERESPRFDSRLSFRKKDKIPYGMYVAFEELKNMFPKASISSERSAPGDWKNISRRESDQALIIVSPQFNPTETEMDLLISFIENGNDVFISTTSVSYNARKILHCNIGFSGDMEDYVKDLSDTLIVSLDKHPSGQTGIYSYPGMSYDFSFNKIDTTITDVLGYNRRGNPNFVHLKAGKGNLFLHLAPLAFSNYFLLHRNNIAYYENVISNLSADKKNVVWDEYFIVRHDQPQSRPNWLKVFLSEPGFRWGMLVALLILLVYTLMEMRRKQRIIPLINKPKNDSLDFVKTIGRLYHDKGDHLNLCHKMAAYFLEYVRNRYKLNTAELDEAFVSQLHFKSGVPEEEIRPIITFINNLDKVGFITEKKLAEFHKQLELFYQKA